MPARARGSGPAVSLTWGVGWILLDPGVGSRWWIVSLGARQCVPAVMLDTQLVRVRYGTLSVSSWSPDCWGAFGAPMPT